jgi:hypothetical protein
VVSKFTESGEILWEQERFYGVCNNYVYDVIETPDGGYVAVGIYSVRQCGFPFLNTFLIKFDANGEEQWVKHFGDDQHQEQGRILYNTPDGGFVFLSYTPYQTYTAIKTDAFGNELWRTSIVSENIIAGGNMDILPNGDVVVMGSFTEEHFLVRINQDGVIQDSFRYERAREGSPNEPFVRTLKYLESIDMYFVGTNHFYIINREGEVVWRSFQFDDLTKFSINNLRDIAIAKNGEILVIALTVRQLDGTTNFNLGSALMRLARPELLISNHELPEPILEMRLYPNPTTENQAILDLVDLENTVSIEVSNVLGQVLHRFQSVGEREVPIPLNAANGFYFVRVQPYNRVFKVVKE